MPDNIRRIYGRRTVLEALRSKETDIERLVLAKGMHGAIIKEIQNEAEARNITMEWMDRRRLDKMFAQAVNQGVVAFLRVHDFADVHDMVNVALAQTNRPLFVISDEIEDPRNLGAIIRCADGAGCHGMITTYHRSADITPVTIKASGGAAAHLPIARVKNLAQMLEDLKSQNIWIAGLDAENGQSIWETDLDRPLAVIIGSEGKGLRRLTKETCDMLISIPMMGKVNSLNASVAAGIALFEIKRQQREKSSQETANN